MKNFANVLAVLLLVVALGLIVGCGCGTTTNRTEEDMVETPNGATSQAPANNDSTMQEDMNNPQGTVNENGMYDTNPIDGHPINDENGVIENGTVGGAVEGAVDGVGNAVGDVIDGVGNAVEDVGNGINNATNGGTTTTNGETTTNGANAANNGNNTGR